MWQTPDRWEPLPDQDLDAWQAVAAADPVEAAIDTLGDEHIGQPLAEILTALQENPDTGARLYAKFRGSNGCHHVGTPPLMAGVGGFFTIRCQR